MELVRLGQQYYDFLQLVGTADNAEFPEKIMQILAPNCQKIMNGTVCGHDRESIYNQLNDARTYAGIWEMLLYKVMPSSESDECFIKYRISSLKTGAFLVMAVLSFDKKGLVILIDEVFHHLEKDNESAL